MIGFLCGFFGTISFFLLFEPLIINFIYLRNIDLFLDLFISKKNQNRLKDYFKDID